MGDSFIINGLGGKQKLSGTISVNGAKNAVLKALASSFLFKDEIIIKNIPKIEDVGRMIELLEDLGVSIKKDKLSFSLSVPKKIDTFFSEEISGKLRASIVVTGPVLARYGSVSFPHPGGCLIGARPIDLFLDGYEKMGATVKIKDDHYEIKANGGKLKGAEIFFKNQSVGATETFMMAGVLASGKTVLKNTACEPEIEHLARYLNSCGAKIKGAGTLTIEIIGTPLLNAKGRAYMTLPDRIETGSFLILGALAARDLKITNCNPSHVEALIEVLKTCGVHMKIGKNTIQVKGGPKFTATNIKTHEYPGFPTDLQAPMAVFLSQAHGRSLIFETIFEGRMGYTEKLADMGADITLCDPHRVIVKGPNKLKGHQLESPDIRAGLAFLVASIIAKGESVIHNIYKIDRGYENIEDRFSKIGVDIKRIKS